MISLICKKKRKEIENRRIKNKMQRIWSFLGHTKANLSKWRRANGHGEITTVYWFDWFWRFSTITDDYINLIFDQKKKKNIHSITSLYINRFGARSFFLGYFISIRFSFISRYLYLWCLFSANLLFFLAISLLVFNALKSYSLFSMIGGGHWHRRVKLSSKNNEFNSQTADKKM